MALLLIIAFPQNLKTQRKMKKIKWLGLLSLTGEWSQQTNNK